MIQRSFYRPVKRKYGIYHYGVTKLISLRAQNTFHFSFQKFLYIIIMTSSFVISFITIFIVLYINNKKS